MAGYGGISLEALAEAVGVGRPSLAMAFGHKRSLYRLAVAAHGVTVLRRWRAALKDADSVEGLLHAAFIVLTAPAPGSGSGRMACLLIAAAAEAPTDPRLQRLLQRTFRRLDRRLARYLPGPGRGMTAEDLGDHLRGLAVWASLGLDECTLQARIDFLAARLRIDGDLTPRARG